MSRRELHDAVVLEMRRHCIVWYDHFMDAREMSLVVLIPEWKYLFKRAALKRRLAEIVPVGVTVEIRTIG